MERISKALKSSLGIKSNDGEKDFLVTKEQLQEAGNGFGGKTIGFLGGFSLLLSNLTGPGLVSLSLVYQDSGWITPTIALVLMMIMSTLSGVFLCEAMATLPGNESLQGRVEFTTLVRFFFGKKGHIVSQIFINVSLQATNIAGIVISSQVMDSMFVDLFHRSCGFAVSPKVAWVCVEPSDVGASESVFGNHFMLFTIGYFVVMAVIIPLGYLNLDDNIIIQVAAMIFLVAVIADWIVMFCLTGLRENVPAITNSQTGVLGTVMFNFAYITTVPSWVNEKKPSVSVHKSLWSACIVSTISFLLVGYLGARAFHMDQDSDILSTIDSVAYKSAFARNTAHILVYLFPLMVLATSIPVYSIIVRYNLLQNKVCNKVLANLFAVVFPWAVAIPFMSGSALNSLINWSSYAFASVANFIIPFVIYIKACNFRLNERERLTEEQHEILLSMHPPKPTPSTTNSATSSARNILAQGTSTSSFKRMGTSSFRNINASSESYQNLNLATVSVNSPDGASSRTSLLAVPPPTNGASSKRKLSIAYESSKKFVVTEPHLVDDDPDAIPTPLPPNFVAIPFTTPQSARWIARVSVVLMVFLVVGVIVLAIFF